MDSKHHLASPTNTRTGIDTYTCPMHPSVERDMPGICPECGMALVPHTPKKGSYSTNGEVSYQEHDKHAGHNTESFLKKFWIVLILTIPILLYSEIFQIAFGTLLPRFSGMNLVFLLLGSVIFFYGGEVFLFGSYRELKAGLPGMMTLIALAITAAYSFSVFQILRGESHNLFWELGTLIAIMLLGHWIEMKAVKGARGALNELSKLLPDTAEVIREGKMMIVPVSELKVGDMVIVKPGGRIPADGVVTSGTSQVNESIVTGESRPVEKSKESKVIAGTVNGDGSLTIEVSEVGEKTFLAGVMRLVTEAQASKSRLQMLSDRAAFYLTVIAVLAGGVTFVLWFLAKAGIVFAVERLVAVLVIACPHALGLAVPLVASISTTMAARNGFLVKQRLALEAARNIDVVLFDKTGTLTRGEFGVVKVIPNQKVSEEEVLRFAASVNNHSEHPLAKAIVIESQNRKITLESADSFERLAGKGARAQVKGEMVHVGSERILTDLSISLPKDYTNLVDELTREGKTVIYVVSKKGLLGAIALADIIRPESYEAIENLKKLGVRVAMITGDSEDVAEWVGKELGLHQYFARVLPHEKADKVKLLQKEGKKVAMVGDGVNDAPALSQADLGIAIGAGTNVAIESAGIILVKNDPRDIPKVIRLSRLTYSKMIQNLFWATGYNIIALPLAAGALAFKGILLQPAIAAVFMSLSTVIVSINALLLRKRQL